MTTITYYRNNIYKSLNGDLSVTNGSIGENVTINATGNFSIVPNVSLQLDVYYNVYTVNTNTPIIITFPSATDVSIGWSCRVNLVSSTGNGSINIVNHLGATIAALASNPSAGNIRSSVYLTLMTTAPLWCEAYSIPDLGLSNQTVILDGGPMLKPINFGNVFAYSATSVNANTTTDVAIPWDGLISRFIDTDYYNIVSNTRITAQRTGIAKIIAFIGVSSISSATLTNLRIRPRYLGATYLTSFIVNTGTILPFNTGSYMFTGMFYLNTGEYIEIMIGKSATSVGTNPTSVINTLVHVEYIAQVQ